MKDAAYLKALQREAYREIHWRNTQQGAFESSFCHIDFGSDDSRDTSPSWLSDGGKGEAAIFMHYDEADRKRKIDAVLTRLSPKDRAFAEAILDGKTWRDLGVPKATFYRKIKKVCSKVRLTPSKTALDR